MSRRRWGTIARTLGPWAGAAALAFLLAAACSLVAPSAPPLAGYGRGDDPMIGMRRP